jgi:hypothetical protein
MFSGRFVFYWTAIVAKYEKDTMGQQGRCCFAKKGQLS